MSDTTTGLWLTEEGYKALQAELETLTTVKRHEIAERIRASQEHGEFSEDNSELDEVKMEQAMVEARISDLKEVFGSAQVLEVDFITTDVVGIGSMVKLNDLEFGDTFEVRVVAGIEADPNRDQVSVDSPLGQALLGQEAGETVSVKAPDGLRSYKIQSIGR